MIVKGDGEDYSLWYVCVFNAINDAEGRREEEDGALFKRISHELNKCSTAMDINEKQIGVWRLNCRAATR